MTNEDYRPNDDSEQVLSALKTEVGGRANPKLIQERTGIRKQYINNSLHDLVTAGWVDKLTRGMYEFRCDPRTGDENPGVRPVEPDSMPGDETASDGGEDEDVAIADH